MQSAAVDALAAELFVEKCGSHVEAPDDLHKAQLATTKAAKVQTAEDMGGGVDPTDPFSSPVGASRQSQPLFQTKMTMNKHVHNRNLYSYVHPSSECNGHTC